MALDDVETSILSSIPDFDSDTGTEDNGTATETTTTENTADLPATTVVEAGSEGGRTNTPTQPTTTEQPAVTRRDGLIEVPSASNPSARDLVDPATGQVVARGGIERRIFEGAQRVNRENQQLTTRLQAAENNAAQHNDIVKLGTTLQLSHQDQQASLNLMSQFLKDPVAMLEKLVIEVKSKGYNIPFLSTGITPGMDTAAIQRMVDARMAPITQQQQATVQQQENQVQAKKTLDTFLDVNPEGQHNLTVLAEMMTAQPGLTIDNAFVRMMKWCHSNGLDYTKPLKLQVEARRSAQQPAAIVAPIPAQPSVPVVPLPNGRQSQGAAPINGAAKFDENSSWSDILRHSMRETGFSV